MEGVNFRRAFLAALILFLLAAQPLSGAIEDSVVKITSISQAFQYDMPWQQTPALAATGTGFLIPGSLILTNAHVVSNARYLEVIRLGDDRKYEARVKFIAHDCDLAILEVVDPNFYKGMVPLELGALPAVNSEVVTYGFPMGGNYISVTRGVVSRIQQNVYSHTGSDSHLVIQTDAAINPGNSGGPVMQGGKVIGVAFQGLTQADNIGYLIPITVMGHFLKDTEDGRVDGFGEIGIRYRYDLQNPYTRELLRIPRGAGGVLVTRTFPGMPAHGVLQPMDVITRIGKFPVGDDGQIMIDGQRVEFTEEMERYQVGETVELGLIRGGEEKTIELKLQRWELSIPHNRPYDEEPRYLIYGGLCFTRLSMGFLLTQGGWAKASPTVRSLYQEAHADESLAGRREFPVLCYRLPDALNQGMESFVGEVVEEVDGQAANDLGELKRLLLEGNNPYVTLRFFGRELPLVLPRHQAKVAAAEILKRYHIAEEERL
ncbi:MAG: trypsin-like peptidase domain-containing protein [Planctomycetes bacterium]|nr:trypsin-like peptidase domain-containing protein [Planctomycetota bacterium]